MSKIVDKEVIDFDYSDQPVSEKKFPINHSEAQDLKDRMYDYMDKFNISIHSAIKKAMADTNANNVTKVVIYYHNIEKTSFSIDVFFILAAGEHGYATEFIIKALKILFKLSISIGIGLILSHFINGVP